MSTGHAQKLLRWYPPAWRDRYGDELLDMVEDDLGGRRAPLRLRASLARWGMKERTRQVLGHDRTPRRRMQGGALVVLCAASVFTFAGCIVAKFSEHWRAVTPGTRGHVGAVAFDVIYAGAATGVALVAVGALVAAPRFVRWIRHEGWRPIRAALCLVAGSAGAFAGTTAAIVVWAHHASARHQGAGWAAHLIVALWALLLLAILATGAAAIAVTISRMGLSARQLRIEATLATGLAATMVTMTAATLVWWVSVARSIRSFPDALSSTPWSPDIVLAAALMVAAASVASAGAVRASGALRDDRRSSRAA